MNKANGGNGIPVELLQILKHDVVNGLNSIWQKIGKLSSGQRLEKVSFHSNPKDRQCQKMFKLPQIALISHASKIMLKILQTRF